MTIERRGTAADESFEELYHAAPFGYVTLAPDDVVVRANHTLLAWTGLSEGDVVGRRFIDLLEPGGRLFYENRHLPMLLLQGEAREVSLALRRADGSAMPALLNAMLVRDDQDRPRLIRVAVFDATTRERYEKELLAAQRAAEASAGRVTVLQNASATFAASTSESELAAGLAAIVSDALAATDSVVATVNGDGSFTVIGGTHLLEGMIDPSEKRPGRDAIESERPIIVTADDQTYPAVADALQRTRLHSLIAIPIMRGSSAMGVVGAYFSRPRTLSADEIDLVVAIARQAGQTLTRIRLQDELAHIALHDQLTGLANRLLLRELISQSIAAARRGAESLSVMFVDLDGFKAVNDRLGHASGDTVLREVAARLRSVVREGDVVGRYGGDEFVVICSDADASAAEAIADRIRDAVRMPFEAAPGFPITASVGIAVHRGSSDSNTDHLIDIADSAMYASKRSGRDRATIAYS